MATLNRWWRIFPIVCLGRYVMWDRPVIVVRDVVVDSPLPSRYETARMSPPAAPTGTSGNSCMRWC